MTIQQHRSLAVGLSFILSAAAAPGQVLITEIMYNPAGPDGVAPPGPTGEWVEIFNPSPDPIDISGWRLDDEDAIDWSPLPAGSLLLPGEAAVIASNPAEFRQAWGPSIKVFGVTFSSLSNTASSANEVLVLRDAAGQVVNTANYEAGTNGWPPSVNGLSIYLRDVSADNNAGANWALSAHGEAGAYSPDATVLPYSASDVGSPGYVSTIAPRAPAQDAQLPVGDVQLSMFAADSSAQTLHVKFFGRVLTTPAPEPFRIVALPDTQYYSRSYPATFTAQTQWIVNQRDALNIAYVAHLGDIVHNADVFGQWQNANTALSILDLLPDLPLGLCVGNHDQYPAKDPAGTAAFNQWFPYTRYQNRNWYGGHYGTDNDNHYVLFSAGGMDFIAIHMEYDTAPPAALLNWARGLLQHHATRRGIVAVHSLLNIGEPAPWTAQGAKVYEALKMCPNLMLMMCGHISGEARRTDVEAGTVHTLLADYQSRSNGGDGWLRILEFRPADNTIAVTTYSPKLDAYERDSDSEFTLHHDMGGSPFVELGQAFVPPGGAQASVTWGGLTLGAAAHQWYATLSGGRSAMSCPIQMFHVTSPGVDLDRDGDVDNDDLAIFMSCWTGPEIAYDPAGLPAACLVGSGTDGRILADSDKDGDVDQADFGILQRCLGGRGKPADPACQSQSGEPLATAAGH